MGGFSGSMLEFRKMVKYKQRFRDTYGLRGITILYFTLMEILQAINYYTLYTPGKINATLALLYPTRFKSPVLGLENYH